ncbi:MAG: four-carbon acid sugar kinase family protein [Bryobacteraceae bacterium]
MRAQDPAAALDCFLIADDLTGACDAAVHFAMRGRRATVRIAPGAQLADSTVIAASTDSRRLEPAAARDAVSGAAASLPIGSPSILFKKIDSTLRGQSGVEITAALTAFGCDAAVACPAFPRMNRIVEAGLLRIAGATDFAPIDVAAHFRAQGAERCVHTGHEALPEAISSGARIVVLDAVSDDDLDRIAAAGLALDKRILWAGSAGLASALARTLPLGPQSRPQPSPKVPVLFCIGSDHRVTVSQQAALVRERRALLVDSGQTGVACIAAALGRGQHAVLRVSRDEVFAKWLQELAVCARTAALMLSGGDTAAQLCRAAGAQRIDLLDEIVPGVPCGVIRGGAFDGISVATKSGGFGGADALIQIADYFTCPTQ